MEDKFAVCGLGRKSIRLLKIRARR